MISDQVDLMRSTHDTTPAPELTHILFPNNASGVLSATRIRTDQLRKGLAVSSSCIV